MGKDIRICLAKKFDNCKEKILDTFAGLLYDSKGVRFICGKVSRNNMEKIVIQTLLYDFYGELLTEHQRSVYEEAVYNDMSLSEIAEQYGISRQGVHDLIKRCDKILNGYEEKLHLVEKFAQAKEKIAQLVELTKDLELTGLDEAANNKVKCIRELSTDLMNEF